MDTDGHGFKSEVRSPKFERASGPSHYSPEMLRFSL
jgi:hypothetical protein